MTARALSAEEKGAGPIGSIAFSALLFLLVTAPLMRGGNRHVALIVIEAGALAFLAALVPSLRMPERFSLRTVALAFVVLSPIWLAVLYLTPVPPEFWNAGAARAFYSELLGAFGNAQAAWRPLSLAPDATTVSLLASIPLVAAFLAGYLTTSRQLHTLFVVLVVVALAQVLFGLLQASGGQASSLYFGGKGGRPFGTFANPNHFANYVSMGLVVYIFLAWSAMKRPHHLGRHAPGDSARTRSVILWGAGAVFLLVGILMSRSRAGTLAALGTGGAAFLLMLALGSRRHRRSWRKTALLTAIAVAACVALVGLDSLLSRFDLDRLRNDIPYRSIQAATTLDGISHFWPWGAGWGTYYSVYPRFQPSNLIGVANHAHHDYLEMLFEGGIFAALLMLTVAGLLLARGLALVRVAWRQRKLDGEHMPAAVCGIALLGFLLHSLVEFSMHIPANAIVACLLAGAYLRPLAGERRPHVEEAFDDRSPLPHPSGH